MHRKATNSPFDELDGSSASSAPSERSLDRADRLGDVASNPESRADPSAGVSFVVLVVGGSVDEWRELGRALARLNSVAVIVACAHPIPDLPRLCAQFRDTPGLVCSVVESGAALLPRALHFVPPGAPVELRAGGFGVLESSSATSLELLSSSIGRDYGERSLALLLEEPLEEQAGLCAIQASGGMLIATTEGHALADHLADDAGSEPRRSPIADRCIATDGFADEVASLVAEVSARPAADEDMDRALDDVVLLARERANRDIGAYDRPYLGARVRRRMNVSRTRAVDGYVQLFGRDEGERAALLNDLRPRRPALFEDAEYWSQSVAPAVAELVERASGVRTLRFWVPDCATGEHAYSLAILVVEALEAAKAGVGVQIFASDVDVDSIRIARARKFTEAEVRRLSEARVKRFFVRGEDGFYAFSKRLREGLVFAVQDVRSDPPYPRIDLIAARNLFDRLCPEMRAELSSVCHYALVTGGALVLRDAGSLPEPSSRFARTSRHGVLRARDVPKRLPPTFGPRATPSADPGNSKPTMRRQVEELVLREHAPPAVVVNERFEIVYFFGHIGKFLQPPSGLPTVNVLELCPLELRSELRFLLQTALRSGQVVTCEGMRMNTGDLAKMMTITARPFPNERGESDLLVVFEEDGTQDTPAPPSETRRREAQAAEVERALQQTREDVQNILEASADAQELLSTSNRELMSTNAELTATNSRLELAKLELQALNTELHGVNGEINRRLRELSDAHDQLRGLFESTGVPTLFLDRALKIHAFTPAARDFFNLISTDSGRPITDIRRRFEHPSFEVDVAEVARTLATKEREVDAAIGGRHLMRIFPYRGEDERRSGLVITFSDITTPAVVAELGQRALDASSLEIFLEEGLALVKKAIGTELCDIVRLNTETNALDRVAAIGLERDVPRLERFTGDGSFTLLHEREPVVLRPGSPRWPAHLTPAGIQSGARVTIWARDDEPFGSLGVYSRSVREFTPQDLAFLQTSARLFASAIQRKQLEDARMRENEERTVQRTEEQLRRAERLASLGIFAAGIAHELNNPLGNIALAAEYAQGITDGPRQAKLLANVVSNAQRCGRIIESVLRFAKNESTRRWLTDLLPLLRHSADLAKSYVGNDRLSVVWDVQEPLQRMSCNPMEIEQVFTNLFRNAIEAHEAHCTVTVQVREGNDSLLVRLSDDGPGIDADVRERIFDPFFSTRRKSGGTGLGLSITHRIVTGHGGSIRCVADAGPGATFELEFPREGSETKHAESLVGG